MTKREVEVLRDVIESCYKIVDEAIETDEWKNWLDRDGFHALLEISQGLYKAHLYTDDLLINTIEEVK